MLQSYTMSNPEIDPSVVINKTQGEFYAARFILASREAQTAPTHSDYMEHIYFLQEATAQLAKSISTQEFSEATEDALRTKFAGYYNLEQIISDIRNNSQRVTVYDTKMSKAEALAYVTQNKERPTGNEKIHTAIFHPFTLSLYAVEPESEDRQEEQIRYFFPNLNTQNQILCIDPIVTVSYPVEILTYGHTDRRKYGTVYGTITTTSARYVKTYKEKLVMGVHTFTTRMDVKGTQEEIAFLKELDILTARIRQYNAQNGGLIFTGDMSGNSK